MSQASFQIARVDYASALEDLRHVREAVFVHEQQVPADLEQDPLDPFCQHVLARDGQGRPMGTGRLTPERRVGRMAVLPEWRGRGVGAALLQALLEQARVQGWPEVSLHAQVSAEDFYVRHGFIPYGERFQEAGIEHQSMRRRLGGATSIELHGAALAMTTAVIWQARRSLYIYSRQLDPGLLDAPPVLAKLKRLATARHPTEIRVLLHDASAPQQGLSPLLPLAQRLPSVFHFRQARDPVDLAYPSAYLVNDGGGYYFRPLGHRIDGEAELDNPARARQLREEFQRFWERSRPCSEYRALGI